MSKQKPQPQYEIITRVVMEGRSTGKLKLRLIRLLQACHLVKKIEIVDVERYRSGI